MNCSFNCRGFLVGNPRPLFQTILLGSCLSLGFLATGTAQTYTPPANNRSDIKLNSGWRFIRQDVSGAQNPGFDDSAWSAINLPHTWNNLDGQDGGNNYYRGIGWYRTHYTVDNSFGGRHFFLKFDGAFLVTDVYVNGNYVGEHQGGFAAFVFDVTPYLNIGADNVIAVKVNNAANTSIPPLSADFTFFGGIYRDVHLLVTDPVQISPLDYGSPGVYLKTTSVSSNSANLQITTAVSNSTASAQTVTVRAVITDAAANVVTVLSNVVTLPAGAISNIVASTIVTNPHLWGGLSDPYLYQAFVELWNNGNAVDMVAQPLGFRWFSVDSNNGFFLNGQHYDLHGVNMHQDWLNCGWALTNVQRETNFLFIKEIGATAVRLSHYEHDDYTYQLADRDGIVLWSEIPLINYITASAAFSSNAQQQLIEMIRQRYNHPSVVCWSVYNEITLSSGPNPTNLISQLVQLAAQEDPTRPPTAAANTSNNDPSTLYTQLIDFNKYYGWYGGTMNDFGPWADNFHATYPTRQVGVSEYGAGASIYQHSEDPVAVPSSGGSYHPEEYQNLFHESYWQQMQARPFLWSKLIWNLFDFASDGRNEGDKAGRNDKGLVTYDRLVRKDAFYWYKANWATEPMVYITGHTFTNRLTNFITAKAYANCDSVELFLNGTSQGTRTSSNHIFTWSLTLQTGTNFIQAVGTKGSTNVEDSLIWLAPTSPPAAAIIQPTNSVVYLDSTNEILQLSATASDQPGAPGPLTTSWSQSSGPAPVTFGDTNALTTTASFSANGIYSLVFRASNGQATTTVGLTVVVGNVPYAEALRLRFAFDDVSGSTTPSDTNGWGANVALQMVNKSGVVTDYHGAVNSGVAGSSTGGRAMDFSSNTTQPGQSGPASFVTNSTALGFGNVNAFVVTMWFKQSLMMALSGGNVNIGPRMFVLGNGVPTDTGVNNSIGLKFQIASQLYFQLNATTTSASFSYNLPTNTWLFLAGAYDGTNVMVYLGSETNPATLITSANVGSQTVALGTSASVLIGNRLDRARSFAGWLDDFRFYTGPFSSDFVETIRESAAGPVGLTATPGNNQVVLNWTGLRGAKSYNIKRSTASGGPYDTITSPGEVIESSYTDFTAVNGVTYFYVCSVVTEFGESGNSTETSAVAGCSPPPAPTAGYNTPLYAGMTLNLVASSVAGATYYWTGPNGFSSTNQNPTIARVSSLSSGTYSVTAMVGSCISDVTTLSVTVNPPLNLSAQPLNSSLILAWPFGTLQSATNLTGPWNDIMGAFGPYTNAANQAQEFFRVKLQ